MMTTATPDHFPQNIDAIAHLTGLTLDPETPPHLATKKTAIPPAAPVTQSLSNTLAMAAPAAEEEQRILQTADTDTLDDTNTGHQIDPEMTGPVFTLRAIVSTKEAGVIIGKEGKNVAEIRKMAQVRAGVTKVIDGINERVLTISGSVPSIAKAFSMIAEHMLELQNTAITNNPETANQPLKNETSIRLLIPHQMMGAVIGKAGSNIKEIQETSGAKMVISKEMLPQSTERTVDVIGLISSIQIAVHQIAEKMAAEANRITGVILYDPRILLNLQYGYNNKSNTYEDNNRMFNRRTATNYNSARFNNTSQATSTNRRYPQNASTSTYTRTFSNTMDDTKRETEVISIPADMVGCLIGKGGASINNIRRMSNAYISISKETNATTQERDFTISGTPEAIDKALKLLYTQLEKEKKKRMEAEENNIPISASGAEAPADE